MVQKRTVLSLLGAMTLLVGLVMQAVPAGRASAAQITARSLTLQAGATDGGSKASGVVNHLFTFTVPNAGNANIGSIKFEYCTTAANDTVTPACVTPTGLHTTSATMGSQSGATGFVIDATTDGAPFIHRTAAAVTANTVLSYQLLSVTNPSTANQTFFVRISTYTSTTATGSPTDTGTVAASTANTIDLTGTMPESLVFCTGAQVLTTSSVPDCSTATSGSITFNKLFSPTDTATATSQMAASTNAGSGYAITVNGVTLTSGSNTITAMGAAAAGVHGLSQFGLNLRANTVATSNPAIGAEVAPLNNASNYRGQAFTGYNTVDQFKFTTGDVIARSDDPSLGGTDAQIFTASYIVNVPGSQPAGTYTTTLTYICTPTF